MAQAQLSTIAGFFTVFWSPPGSSPAYVNLGQTREGATIETTVHEQDVHSDAFGDAIAETIQQGVDYRVTLTGIEYTKVKQAMFALPVTQGNVNTKVGLRGTDLYGPLALTPIVGTPASTEIGAGNSYVFPLTAPGNNINILLSSKLREINLSFKALTVTGSAYSITTTPAGVTATL